jgi:hypothetical protein
MSREAELVGAETCMSARRIGQGFRKPDDDWASVCLVWRDGGVRATFHVPVPLAEDGADVRDVLFRVIVPALIREQGGTAAALVQSCWYVISRSPEEAAMVAAWGRAGRSLEDLPSRIEVVSVTAADADGVLHWIARIERDGTNPPTLGEWEPWEGTLDGRISDGLLAAVNRKERHERSRA